MSQERPREAPQSAGAVQGDDAHTFPDIPGAGVGALAPQGPGDDHQDAAGHGARREPSAFLVDESWPVPSPRSGARLLEALIREDRYQGYESARVRAGAHALILRPSDFAGPARAPITDQPADPEREEL